MQQNKLIEELTLIQDIKQFAQAYEEISVIRMQATRGLVLKTRTFLDGIGDIFFHVKNSYQKQILALLKVKKKSDLTKISTINKNGKSVLVFLSANNKFYGNLTRRVFETFIKDAKLMQDDLVIIGKLGKLMYENEGILKAYEYFDLQDANFPLEELKPIITRLVPYEKVTMYYGKFINVISQTASTSNITGEEPFSEVNLKQQDIKFVFEPSLEKILNYFEEQIFTSLFIQTVHEAELARYASRIKAMEESLEHINAQQIYVGQQERRLKSFIENKKQQQAFSGISLWNK